MNVASVDGLEGLTFGRLAAGTGESKSALQALFGTKEQLQLAILETLAQLWDREVRRPALAQADGLERLRALVTAWIDYLDRLDGGCLFITASIELDARPGPVRDAVVTAIETGLAIVGRQATLAVRLGELAADTDVDQLVSELHGVVLKANYDRQLLGREDAGDRAHRAVGHIIERYATS